MASETPNMLHLMFFALVLGIAATLVPSNVSGPLVRVMESLFALSAKLIDVIMRLAPYGVACLIFTVSSRFGFDLMIAVAAFVVTVLIALAAHVAITLFSILQFGMGLSPLVFVSRVKAALTTASSTSSSSATLPTGLDVAENQLGVPRRIAGFVLPIGSTMCMNGTAIFEGISGHLPRAASTPSW